MGPRRTGLPFSSRALLRVYWVTMVAAFPFFDLSPFFRRRFGPRRARLALPRCRAESGRSFFSRFPRRFSSSSSVAVGVAFQSTWVTSTSPSPSGAGAEENQFWVYFPNPRTAFSTVVLEGDQELK